MDSQEETLMLMETEHNTKASSQTEDFTKIQKPSSPLVPLDMSLGRESSNSGEENDCQVEDSRLTCNEDQSSGHFSVQTTVEVIQEDSSGLLLSDGSIRVPRHSENSSRKKGGTWRGRVGVRRRIGRIPKRRTCSKSTCLNSSESTHPQNVKNSSESTQSQNTKNKEMENSLKKLWGTICRVCAGQSHRLIRIFGAEGNRLGLHRTIHTHLPIQVDQNDMLPLGVCLSCVESLSVCDKLRSNCLRADRHLRSILDNHMQSNMCEGEAVDDGILCLEEVSLAQNVVEPAVKLEIAENFLEKCSASPFIERTALFDSDGHNSESEASVKQEIEDDLSHSSQFHTARASSRPKRGQSKSHIEKTREKKKSLSQYSLETSNNSCGTKLKNSVKENSQKRCFIKTTKKSGDMDDDRMQNTSNSPQEDCVMGSSGKCDTYNSSYGFKNKLKKKDNSARESSKKILQTCNICKQDFAGVLELARHRKTHTPEERLKCWDCGKVMPNDNSFKSHRKTHTDNVHPCEQCGKVLASRSSLAVHRLTHVVPQYCCQICGKTLRTVTKLQEHMATHSDERPLSCPTCGQRFKTQQCLRQHSLIHVEHPMFVCDICGHACRRRTHLTKHMRKHANPKYSDEILSCACSCGVCKEEFTSLGDMLRHRKGNHSEEEVLQALTIEANTLQCCACGKVLSTARELLIHEMTHISCTFVCELCGRSFASSESLKYHAMEHTGELPYTCKTCGKGFRARVLLQRHERVHTGERPFKCLDCGKAFRCNVTLYQHKKTHSVVKKYKCSFCPYESVRAEALKIHVRVHTNERPYPCRVCGWAFKQKNDCVKHEALHNRPEGVRRKLKHTPRQTDYQFSISVPDDGSSHELQSLSSQPMVPTYLPHRIPPDVPFMQSGTCSLLSTSDSGMTMGR